MTNCRSGKADHRVTVYRRFRIPGTSQTVHRKVMTLRYCAYHASLTRAAYRDDRDHVAQVLTRTDWKRAGCQHDDEHLDATA